jgi:hypothetical protein
MDENAFRRDVLQRLGNIESSVAEITSLESFVEKAVDELQSLKEELQQGINDIVYAIEQSGK